jgi:hypothetical protein
MKSMYLILLALGVTLNISAQISTFPYTESFGASSQLTGWTATTGTWYHSTSTGTIEVDNHSQTNVHAFLYSPWLNTMSLNNPVVQFDIKITADNSSSCVPELDLGYNDSSGSGAINVIQFNIASNNQCTGGLSTFYPIQNDQWTTLSFPLVWFNHIQLEFNSVFVGTGTFAIRNVYVGERLNTGIEDLKSQMFSVSPNPASDKLSVSFETTQSGTAEMYLTDVLGKTVQTELPFATFGMLQRTIDVSNLSNGIYLLHVLMNGKQCTQKVVISH